MAALLLTTAGCASSNSQIASPPTTSSVPSVSTVISTPVVTVTAAPSSPAAAPPSTTSVAPAPAPAPGPAALPRITVRGGEGRPAPTSLQRFADDVADGKIDRVVNQCWTVAPSRLRGALTDAGRAEILRIFSTSPMKGAQSGWYWESGNKTIGVDWSEADSTYACPSLGPNTVSEDDARLVIRRMVAAHKGQPIRPLDAQLAPHLICEFGPLETAGMSNAHWSALAALDRGPVSYVSQGERAIIRPASGRTPQAEIFISDAGMCLDALIP